VDDYGFGPELRRKASTKPMTMPSSMPGSTAMMVSLASPNRAAAGIARRAAYRIEPLRDQHHDEHRKRHNERADDAADTGACRRVPQAGRLLRGGNGHSLGSFVVCSGRTASFARDASGELITSA
jgi:hypothetical protein